jgi:hypothetical protein
MSAGTANPIDLMFGGMEKLGPGSNEDTLHVLRLLPRRRFSVVVDAFKVNLKHIGGTRVLSAVASVPT